MGIDWKDRFEKNIPPTKGPWHWEDWGGAAALVGEEMWTGISGVQQDDVSVANAALIAAAPELRDALELTLTVLDAFMAEHTEPLEDIGADGPDTYGKLRAARALLARLRKEGAGD